MGMFVALVVVCVVMYMMFRKPETLRSAKDKMSDLGSSVKRKVHDMTHSGDCCHEESCEHVQESDKESVE